MAGHTLMHGFGAVSPAGLGTDALAGAVRANRPLLAPCPRFRGTAWAGAPLGTIPDPVWESLRARHPDCRDRPALLLALAAAGQALTQAAPALAGVAPARLGLALSTTKADIGSLEAAAAAGGRVTEKAVESAQPHALARELALRLNLRGPVQAVSLACVSGLVALQQAAVLLQRREADAMLAVGVDILSAFVVSGFHALRSLDPEGCRPFDRTRRGLSPGEAAAAVVLTRDAPGGAPLGRLLGWGSSDDANHLTGPSRDGGGLALALDRARRQAGLDPAAIAYVHAHGTGTVYNDAMELLALRKVFGKRLPPFASSKALTGHTMGAAGVLETVLALTAARAGQWPGTPGLIEPDPEAAPAVACLPRPARNRVPFLKMNSGFGGVNAALVLEAC